MPLGTDWILSTARRFLRHPLIFISNTVRKLFVEPFIYKQGSDYDASSYWQDRLSRYGTNLRGVGDDGKTAEENREDYEKAAEIFLQHCREHDVDFETVNVLEIGVGTGWYTGVLAENGVKDYLGIDITDAMFPELREEYPGYEFRTGDITEDAPGDTYDLIVMIDVIQHIVTEENFSAAMENVRGCLADGGILILSGLRKKSGKELFYTRGWTADEVAERFPDSEVDGPHPFRPGSELVVVHPG